MMMVMMLKMSDKDVMRGHVADFDGSADGTDSVFFFFGVPLPHDGCTV